jgi:hypothetical protein
VAIEGSRPDSPPARRQKKSLAAWCRRGVHVEADFVSASGGLPPPRTRTSPAAGPMMSPVVVVMAGREQPVNHDSGTVL